MKRALLILLVGMLSLGSLGGGGRNNNTNNNRTNNVGGGAAGGLGGVGGMGGMGAGGMGGMGMGGMGTFGTGGALGGGGRTGTANRAGTAVPPADADLREIYSYLTLHNIFQRDRGRLPEPVTRPVQTVVRAQPPIERSIILTGITYEEDEFRAHLENTARERATMRVGDAVARGTIEAIDLDGLIYNFNGQKIRVNLGYDFTGTASAALPTASTASMMLGVAGVEERMRQQRLRDMGMMPEVGEEGGDSMAVPMGPVVDPSGLSLEEQMRLRRQREMGQIPPSDFTGGAGMGGGFDPGMGGDFDPGGFDGSFE
jgi:hypothetical protein